MKFVRMLYALKGLRLRPETIQRITQAWLWFGQKCKGLVILVMLEVDLERAVLKVNVIKLVDEKCFGDPVRGVGLFRPRFFGDYFRDGDFFVFIDSCFGQCIFSCVLRKV